ncbi:hypothetical protein SA07_0114 [Salmonella enterica subsp. enterica serovar Agona str. 07.O.05]|nr:hypothetical protein SA07_0114 [Salmonella enterica subsp. enterica serovar Agona str. 07.O.05]
MIIGIRFIPAGAGNTSYSRKCLGDDPVYPRWRGEHDRAGYRSGLFFGLSPSASHSPLTGFSPLARGTRGISCRPCR